MPVVLEASFSEEGGHTGGQSRNSHLLFGRYLFSYNSCQEDKHLRSQQREGGYTISFVKFSCGITFTLERGGVTLAISITFISVIPHYHKTGTMMSAGITIVSSLALTHVVILFIASAVTRANLHFAIVIAAFGTARNTFSSKITFLTNTLKDALTALFAGAMAIAFGFLFLVPSRTDLIASFAMIGRLAITLKSFIVASTMAVADDGLLVAQECSWTRAGAQIAKETFITDTRIRTFITVAISTAFDAIIVYTGIIFESTKTRKRQVYSNNQKRQ